MAKKLWGNLTRTLRETSNRRCSNIKKYDPCPCGSGKKYKFCCWDHKPQELHMDFVRAIQAIKDGHKITRASWNNPQVYICMAGGFMSIMKEDSRFHALLVSDADIRAEDWQIIEKVPEGEDAVVATTTEIMPEEGVPGDIVPTDSVVPAEGEDE